MMRLLFVAAACGLSAALQAPSPLPRRPLTVWAAAEELPMTDDNVELVLEEARTDLGAMFGYSDESRSVGITGTVNFVETNGPNVILRLG